MQVTNEMLTMQGGHRDVNNEGDVNNAGWPQRCKQCRVDTEMLTSRVPQRC